MWNRILSCLMVLAVGLALAAPLLASEAGPAGEGDINPLGPSAWKLDLGIWTAVVFVVLLLVLGKFAWKPIAEGLDNREKNVADQIAQAEAANQKAKDILVEYERKLADAQQQVRGILDQGRQNAEHLGRELIDKAKEEAQAEYQRAVKQIDSAADAAVKELAEKSATLAVELAGKIVRTKLTASDHTRLIDAAVAGFARRADASTVSPN
jgi:F-type H+-transporting ATPase subunit b